MKTTLYFHSDKSSMEDSFKDLCKVKGKEPKISAIQEAMRVGYEIEIEGEWNSETGKFMATHLMGTKLETPTEI